MRADLLATRALTDPLTGLANRYAAEERFTTELANADRSGQPLAVLMLDLDHFKRINDSHGHDVGDQVLVALATVLRGELRAGDLLALWRGEELVALLPGTDLAGPGNLAERCRSAVADARPLDLAVCVTIGVAAYVPGESERSLLQRADTARYRDKFSGRNQVVVASGHDGEVAAADEVVTDEEVTYEVATNDTDERWCGSTTGRSRGRDRCRRHRRHRRAW